MATVQPTPALMRAVRLCRPVAVVAGVAAGTPTALALLCALLARQPGMGARDTVALAGALLAGTYGVPVSFSGAMMLSGHVGAMPLTLTVASVVATAWAFRRATARLYSGRDGVITAVAAATVTSLAVLVLVALGGAGHLGEAGPAGGALFQAGAAGAFLGSLVITGVVLGLMALSRPGWLPGRAAVVGDVVAAAVRGVGVLLVLLPLVGLLTGVAAGVTGHHDRSFDVTGAQTRAGVAGAIAYVADAGVWSLVLGAGGRVGVSGFESLRDVASRLLGVDVPEPGRLGMYAAHMSGLWIAVVLTPLALAIAAHAAVRAARVGCVGRPGRSGRSALLAGIGLWVAAQLVVVPLLVHASGLRLSAQALGFDASGGFGAVGWEATLLLTAYALVVGAGVAGGRLVFLGRRALTPRAEFRTGSEGSPS